MQKALSILVVLAATSLAGCTDSSSPRDVSPPAAPRGVFSVTGDHQATLTWMANTESDIAGYRVYEAPCASGTSCPYDRIGATATTQFVASGLTNGITRFFAVSAVDKAGNESELSIEDVFDTPRPAGSGILNNYVNNTAFAGWDFSAFTNVSYDNAFADIVYGNNGSVAQMFATSVEVQPGVFVPNDIQDAGYASSLDAVDFSPVGASAGWSPTGSVELIPGHCYIVWTWDDHYAKFRVTNITPGSTPSVPGTVSFEWAYQTATGNPELKARPTKRTINTPRTFAWLR